MMGAGRDYQRTEEAGRRPVVQCDQRLIANVQAKAGRNVHWTTGQLAVYQDLCRHCNSPFNEGDELQRTTDAFDRVERKLRIFVATGKVPK
jgi:hypothetical protein